MPPGHLTKVPLFGGQFTRSAVHQLSKSCRNAVDRAILGSRSDFSPPLVQIDYASANARGWSIGGQNPNLRTGVIRGGRSPGSSTSYGSALRCEARSRLACWKMPVGLPHRGDLKVRTEQRDTMDSRESRSMWIIPWSRAIDRGRYAEEAKRPETAWCPASGNSSAL